MLLHGGGDVLNGLEMLEVQEIAYEAQSHRTLRVRCQARWRVKELRLGTIVEYLGISAVAFVVGAAHGFTDCEEAAHALEHGVHQSGFRMEEGFVHDVEHVGLAQLLGNPVRKADSG